MTENVPLFIVAKTVLNDKQVIAFVSCLTRCCTLMLAVHHPRPLS